MSSGLSQVVAQKVIDHISGRTAYAMPTSPVYIALLTSTASSVDTGTTVATKEATYSGYARAALPAASLNSAGSAAGSASDTNANAQVNFNVCTSGTSDVTHFAVCTALTGGDMLWFGALPGSQHIASGITPDIPVSSITFSGTETNGFSNYLMQKILDHVNGKAALPQPTLYFGLFKTVPASDGTGGAEADFTSYARQLIATGSGGDMNAATATATYAQATSKNQITMAQCTGGSNTINGWGIWDSLTTGGSNNLLFMGAIVPSVTVNNGVTPVVPSGQLTITINNS